MAYPATVSPAARIPLQGEELVAGSSLVQLTNGNYVIGSPYWVNNTGAVTFGNGNTGLSGILSASNSLVGSTPNPGAGGYRGDQVGINGALIGAPPPTPLTNGNYVVNTAFWSNDRGAITWGNGTGHQRRHIGGEQPGRHHAGKRGGHRARHRAEIRQPGGARALTTSAPTGRSLIFSQDPANDTLGGLTYAFKQYNATFGATAPAQESGNGVLYTLAPTLTANLTGSVSKAFDGTTAATLRPSNYTVTGTVAGDTATLNNPAGGTYDTADVGTGKTVTVGGLAANASNGSAAVNGYQLASSIISAPIGTITGIANTPVNTAPVPAPTSPVVAATVLPSAPPAVPIAVNVAPAAPVTPSIVTPRAATPSLIDDSVTRVTGKEVPDQINRLERFLRAGLGTFTLRGVGVYEYVSAIHEGVDATPKP